MKLKILGIVALLVIGGLLTQGGCYLFWRSSLGQNYIYLDYSRKQAVAQAEQRQKQRAAPVSAPAQAPATPPGK